MWVGHPRFRLSAALAGVDESFDCGGNILGDRGSLGGEGWDEPGVGSEDVGDDGDFSVAGVVAAADADGGDLELGGEVAGDFGEDAFEDDAETAGFLDDEGALVEVLDFAVGAALLFVAAFFEDSLGEHAEVTQDRDAIGNDGADFLRLSDSTFQFDRFSTGFDEKAGIAEGFLGGGVAVDGQVGNEERGVGASGGGGGVVEHVLHGDVGRVRVAEDDHAQGITDEEEVRARFVEEAGGGVVVGGERGDGRAGRLALSEGVGFLRTSHERGDHRFCRARGRI